MSTKTYGGHTLAELKKLVYATDSAAYRDLITAAEECERLMGSDANDQPCDECGVNTLALLKERDQLRADNERLRRALIMAESTLSANHYHLSARECRRALEETQ